MKSIIDFIKDNLKLIGIIYVIGITIACIFAVKSCSESEETIDRLETNEIALTAQLDTFKTENGKNAAKVITLEMTVEEFKKTSADQLKAIEELDLKVKRLQSISTTISRTNVETNTKLKDTVIYVKRDTVFVPIKSKAFEWSDTWNKIEGIIKGDNVQCRYEGIDTLTITAVKVPKKFLFFRWGCKYIETDIMHSNTSSTIIYNKTVNLTKKK